MTSDEHPLDDPGQVIESHHDHLPVATMQRLALFRYLYVLGINQTRQPEPLAALAVLSLHDSVELFLHLCAEHADAQRGQLSRGKMLKFEEYFGIINEAIAPRRLSHQAAMVRLNEARIGLKHHGTATARLTVEQLGADVTRFFGDNTPVVFSTEFGNISMANLVASDSARTYLRNAEAELESGNTEAASEFIAVAFQHLIRE